MGAFVRLHFSRRTFRAGASMDAKSTGTIPSPLTSFPTRPKSGRYELAATTSSTSVVRKLPLKLVLQTQVISMPASAKDCDEHEGDSAISRRRPLVWSTKASSGEMCGVPSVTSDVQIDGANCPMAVEDLQGQKLSTSW